MPPPLRKILAAAQDVHPAPTDAPRDAGNYRVGHAHFHGLDVTIETAKGQVRTKVNAEGKRWSRTMAHHYGYIRGTQDPGDGAACDVFIGDHPQSQLVFVVDQKTPDGRKHDEHKILLGFLNAEEARAGYLKHYPKDWKGFGGMRGYFMPDFKRWLSRRRARKAAAALTDALPPRGGLASLLAAPSLY